MTPLYRFRAKKGGCSTCGGEGFEVLQKVTDEDPKGCPDCESRVDRVIGRLGKNFQTDKRLYENRSNADYRRMGLKKFRKTSKGYEREA